MQSNARKIVGFVANHSTAIYSLYIQPPLILFIMLNYWGNVTNYSALLKKEHLTKCCINHLEVPY